MSLHLVLAEVLPGLATVTKPSVPTAPALCLQNLWAASLIGTEGREGTGNTWSQDGYFLLNAFQGPAGPPASGAGTT